MLRVVYTFVLDESGLRMLNKIPNVQVSDTRGDEQNYRSLLQKISNPNFLHYPIEMFLNSILQYPKRGQ